MMMVPEEEKVEQTLKLTRNRGTFLAAVSLFFTAPLIAEFLLGVFPVTMLPALIVLAPMYGGAALLIREVVRRTGRGWISIVILGLAYGLIEEGFATQSLFNPNYLSLNMHLLQPAFIPQLGIGALWTVYVLTLHAAWSIATPIALIEGFFPQKADRPWLSRTGLVVVALLFFAGVAAIGLTSYKKDHFVSSSAQFISAASLCVVLVLIALRLPRSQSSRVGGWVPSPWLAGVVALAAASVVLVVPRPWNWGAVAVILAVDLGMCGLGLVWGRREGWGAQQKLSLAAGAALAYAWHSFFQGSVAGGSVVAMRISHGIFSASAVALIVLAARRTVAHRDGVKSAEVMTSGLQSV
jgi:hypothetical protein